ncbi:MAG: iron ABC transporter permease [Fervidicoccaceae archaeon]|nr:iron ABC transporter permease [Fervidicoccaceae archaeon]
MSARKLHRQRLLFLLVILVLLFILVPLSVSMGVIKASFLDVIKLMFNDRSVPPEIEAILMLRLKRALAAVAVGAILGAGGASMQAVLRNPMASPFTLGISHAAALGVAVSLLMGVSGTTSYRVITVHSPYLLPLFAFIFSLIQVAVILALSYRAGLTERAIILAAIAISFFYQALLSFFQYLFLNELQVAMVVFWTFGDLGRIDWTGLKITVGAAVLLSIYYMARSFDLDLISLSDDVAYSSGVNPKRLRLEATIMTALGASVATSFAGVLAFLCLVAPHVARLVVGGAHRYLLPASMLTGSLLVLVADTLGRVILSPVVLPVGIVLSLVGAPLLVYLLLKGGG